MSNSPFFKRYLPVNLVTDDDAKQLAEFQANSDRLIALAHGHADFHMDNAVDVTQRAFMADPSDANLEALHRAVNTREMRKVSRAAVVPAIEGAHTRYIQTQFCPWAVAFLERLTADVKPKLEQAMEAEAARSVEMFGSPEGAEPMRRHSNLVLTRLAMLEEQIELLARHPQPDYSARTFVREMKAMGIDFPAAADATDKGTNFLKALSRAGVALSPSEFALLREAKDTNGQPVEEYYLQDQVIANEEASRARREIEAESYLAEHEARQALQRHEQEERARRQGEGRPSIFAPAPVEAQTAILTEEQAAAAGVVGEPPVLPK